MDKQVAVYDNTITAREYIGYIAEQAGGFACIGRDGKLYIKTIGQETEELPLKYFQNYTWGESFKISRIYYTDGIQLFEKGDTTGNTIYISQDNMYIVSENQIDSIYEKISGLEIYSFEGDSIINPALDIGDILLIDGKKVIYQGSCEYKGKFKANISSKIQSKTVEETTTRIPSQVTINRRIQSQIDQAEGTITLLAQRQEDANDELETVTEKQAQMKEDMDSISMKVSETISSLDSVQKQQTDLEVASDGLKVDIQKIQDNGVSSVQNKLITIDINGIQVTNDEQEFKSVINETGMYLNSYDKEIASYTKDGATMYNLTVQNEAIIGNLRCLSVDVNNETRTHIHWIGG